MKKIIYLLVGLFLISSCSDTFEEINTDLNATSKVRPEFLTLKVMLDITSTPGNKALLNDSWLMKSTQFTEGEQSLVYNVLGTYGFGGYPSTIEGLKLVELVQENAKLAKKEVNGSYLGLLSFAKARLFYEASMRLGDVPTKEALQGEQDKFNPKYTPQEQVFGEILTLLDSAAAQFGRGQSLKPDIVFGGDAKKWQRMVNSYQLNVLNMLSKKNKVGSVTVKTKFEEVAARDLIDAEENSFQRVFDNEIQNQFYPLNTKVNNFTTNAYMADFMVDMLKKYQDRRLFYYAEPAGELASAGEDKYEAYAGVDPTLAFSEMRKLTAANKISPLNKRYYEKKTNEPFKFVSYSSTQFVLAEAALRGWTTPNSVQEHYNNAVKASMQFTAKHAEGYNHNVSVDDAYLNTYLTGAADISKAADDKAKLELIMEQKYIANFIQMPYNSFFDYRRTELPALPINPSTNLNEKKDRMPVRWRYASSESTENKAAYQEAIKRQFSDNADLNNNLTWLLK